MRSALGRALVAGAAGTLALEITTYLDVAIRGRAPSDVPERVVGRLASKAGVDALAETRDDETAQHRRVGVSAVVGYMTGLATAAGATLAWSERRRMPLPVIAVATGAAAMALSDAGATALGVTDPKSWGASGWLADAIPHAVFGFTTAIVLAAISPPRSRSQALIQAAESSAQAARRRVASVLPS